jgi:hypothetical protein
MKIKKTTLEKVFEIGVYPFRIISAFGFITISPLIFIIYMIIYDHENMDFKRDIISYIKLILETLLIEVEEK